MVSADIGKNYRYQHRYRPIWKTHISVIIGIGRYEKTMIVRPLKVLLFNFSYHLRIPQVLLVTGRTCGIQFFNKLFHPFSEILSKIDGILFEIIEKECCLFVYKKCPINKKNFVFDPILTKLCEIVVLMSTTISQSFIKIGSKTKNFYY